ncbi:MAG: hypothetical protein M3442_17100 [Chloroflexota bacterium]|nr:hypothetical protein [Chloroflexota bacterium]
MRLTADAKLVANGDSGGRSGGWQGPLEAARQRAVGTVRGLVGVNLPLALTGGLMALALAGSLIGLLVDPRVITGAPAWLKPAKFAVSLSIYAFTFLWLLTFVQGHRRLVAVAGSATAAVSLVEFGIIALQVVRGTTSHFNFATPLDGALFSIMGGAIVVLWTMAMLLAVLLLRQRLPQPAFAWSLRLGVLVSVVGMGVAFFMTHPTPQQSAARPAGGSLSISGAHSVGVADGGPGLPIVGWSTTGGDLRAPHFMGLHALQALPLLGWIVTRQGARRLNPGRQLSLVALGGLGYLGLVLLLTWQALRGQSVVAPDGATLTALGGLVAVVAGGALATLAGARRPATA